MPATISEPAKNVHILPLSERAQWSLESSNWGSQVSQASNKYLTPSRIFTLKTVATYFLRHVKHNLVSGSLTLRPYQIMEIEVLKQEWHRCPTCKLYRVDVEWSDEETKAEMSNGVCTDGCPRNLLIVDPDNNSLAPKRTKMVKQKYIVAAMEPRNAVHVNMKTNFYFSGVPFDFIEEVMIEIFRTDLDNLLKTRHNPEGEQLSTYAGQSLLSSTHIKRVEALWNKGIWSSGVKSQVQEDLRLKAYGLVGWDPDMRPLSLDESARLMRYLLRNKHAQVHQSLKLDKVKLMIIRTVTGGFYHPEITKIKFVQDVIGAYDQIHLCPFSDTVPNVYKIDFFHDCLAPYFNKRTALTLVRGDRLSRRGVEFLLLNTQLREHTRTLLNLSDVMQLSLPARVDRHTKIYTDGVVHPHWLDLIQPHHLRSIRALPSRLQPMVLFQEFEELDPIDFERVLSRMPSDINCQEDKGNGNEYWANLSKMYTCAPNEVSETFCVICRGAYEEDEQVFQYKCKHSFHLECSKFWFVENKSCPICRTSD